RELQQAADPEARRAELVDEYIERYANPYVAAERGYVDDVIEPQETRLKLIAGLEMLRSKREELPKRKHGNVPLCPLPRGATCRSPRARSPIPRSWRPSSPRSTWCCRRGRARPTPSLRCR